MAEFPEAHVQETTLDTRAGYTALEYPTLAPRMRRFEGKDVSHAPPTGVHLMPEKVLIYSRFPKALMLRIGERYELLDAAGKPPNEMFSAEQLSDVSAMITAGGTALGGNMMDMLPNLRAIVCYGTGYDGVDLAAVAPSLRVCGRRFRLYLIGFVRDRLMFKVDA